MSANFCPNCGAPLKPNMRFCGKCGNKIISDIENDEVKNPTTLQVSVPEKPLQDIKAPKNTTNLPNTVTSSEVKEKVNDAVKASSEYGKDKINEFQKNGTVKDIKDTFFTSEGRLNRMAYFTKVLILFIPAFIGGILTATGILAIIGVPILVICSVGGIMLQIRRWHDLNKSGWFIILTFIPYLNFVVALYVLFAPGTRGANQYGADPLEGKY